MSEIDTLVKKFIGDLRALMKQSALADMQAALGKASGVDLVYVKKNERRSVAAMDGIREKIVALLRKQPGMRSEELQAELKVTGAQLTIPLRKLIDERAVKTVGVARGTRYSLR